MDKIVLLASFIFPEKVDSFIDYLYEKLQIPKNKIFVYKNLDDDTRLIVTFKIFLNKDNPINFKEIFPNSTIIHKKGECIYTINALNKLIEDTNYENIGNVDNKDIKINWDNYQNKMLLYRGNNLKISNIKRIF